MPFMIQWLSDYVLTSISPSSRIASPRVITQSHTPAPAGIQGAAESSSAEVTRLQSEVDSLRAYGNGGANGGFTLFDRYVKQLESKQAELEAAASKSLPCAPSTTTKGEEDSADEVSGRCLTMDHDPACIC